jgi:hypothetical protein
MLHPKEILESLVVRDYLNGKTRKQIARDNKTSTGNVSNITTKWKQRIGKPEAEEIREFVVLVKKSGVSVKQCADGFRTTQLMKKTGILNDNENENDPDSSEEFIAFVKEIYLNCKNVGVQPAILVRWIQDLFDFFSIDNDNNNNNNPFFSFTKSSGNEEDDHQYNEDATTDLPQFQHQQFRLEFDEPSGNIQPNETTWVKNLNDLYDVNSLSQDGSGYTLHSKPCSTNRIKIPFISQVSGFIAQGKIENSKIKKYYAYIQNKTKKAKLQDKLANQNLAKTIKKERHVMHYLDWFYKLKQELWDRHGIRIEEIPKFAKVINDFKNHNYDPYEIIKVHYNTASVTQELATIKESVESLGQQKRLLIGEVVSLAARLSAHKQTMDTFDELQAMGFGLAELKQIRNAVLELSSLRNITSREAVGIFINDIEKNYFDKLLFEDRLNEKKGEMEKIRNEFPNYRYNLQLQSIVGPTLSHLIQNGVTGEDIISMNQLVTDFANNNFFLDSTRDADITVEGKTKSKDRVYCWRIFIDKLKKLGDINQGIREQKENFDKMEKNVSDVKQKKQELDAHIETAGSLLDYKSIQLAYVGEFFNHAYKHFNKKIIGSFRPCIFFINIINTKSGKDDKRDNDKDG